MHGSAFDGSGPIWTPPVIIAALGPRMLEVAAELADGAHPFLTTPDHTAQAREVLGPDRILAVEQGVVLGDPETAREAARGNLARFLHWPNYRRHLIRQGFDETDFADGASDRLVDATFAIGGVDAIRRRVEQHLAAGADHVGLQVVCADNEAEVAAIREIAPAVLDI